MGGLPLAVISPAERRERRSAVPYQVTDLVVDTNTFWEIIAAARAHSGPGKPSD